MNAIAEWFNGSKDYYTGVAIYATLDNKKVRTLKRLNRGKNNQNMSTLVSELRKHNREPKLPPPPKNVIPKPLHPNQEEISTEHLQNQIAKQSADIEFSGIRIGSLPEELRPRFVRAKTIFFTMIELKFALNAIPDKDHEAALNIIVQIMDLDDERDLIWEELNHWTKHRTLLPPPKDDLEGLTPIQLLQKKNNLKSNISKLTSRIDAKYEKLSSLKDGHDKLLLESGIRKSEELLHQHKINFKRINDMI